MILLARESVLLSAASARRVSTTLVLPTLTETLAVSLHRPTASRPLAWDEGGTLRVHIIVEVDGVEYRCTGRATGAVRLDHRGVEMPEHRLVYRLPWGFFGAREGSTRRLGETSRTAYRVRVELEHVNGSIETAVELLGTEAPAPAVPFRSSVAFDAATDANEVGGDGILTLSHTASGSNRAVFAGTGNIIGTPRLTSSFTYGADALTELWDATFEGSFAHCGAYRAAPATGAQTVTHTLAGTADYHGLGVISMTGVDPTTPVGTPATATGTSATPSVTVGGLGSGGLVVDSLWCQAATVTMTAQTGRVERYREEVLAGTVWLTGSSQPGSTGGTMPWTLTSPVGWGLGAVEFKTSDSPPVTADYSAFPKPKIAEAVLRGDIG